MSAVPYFVIDGPFGVPGAQASSTMQEILRTTWDRQRDTVAVGFGLPPAAGTPPRGLGPLAHAGASP